VNKEYNDLFLLDAFFRKTLFSVKYFKKKVWTSQPAHRPKDFFKFFSIWLSKRENQKRHHFFPPVS
jgi:hypothetical protein